jgi:hypothetical protein
MGNIFYVVEHKREQIKQYKMKNLKTIMYSLTIFLVFSCSTNEEILEVESVKVETEIQTLARGRGTFGDQLYMLSLTVEYVAGISEADKALIRAESANEIEDFSVVQCSLNPDAEIWYFEVPVPYTSPEEILIQINTIGGGGDDNVINSTLVNAATVCN